MGVKSEWNFDNAFDNLFFTIVKILYISGCNEIWISLLCSEMDQRASSCRLSFLMGQFQEAICRNGEQKS